MYSFVLKGGQYNDMRIHVDILCQEAEELIKEVLFVRNQEKLFDVICEYNVYSALGDPPINTFVLKLLPSGARISDSVFSRRDRNRYTEQMLVFIEEKGSKIKTNYFKRCLRTGIQLVKQRQKRELDKIKELQKKWEL